jgi:sirohydrochlorin ferrochelatase
MPGTSVIILAHGSRGEREPFERLKEIVRRLQDRLGVAMPVSGAALQFNHPNLEEAIEEQIVQGATNIVILPYFLFDGTHINVDIPGELDALQQRHPGVNIAMGRTLGVEDRLIEVLVDRLAEAGNSSLVDGQAVRRRLAPREIEAESMAIIERLLPANGWTPQEREVAKRMIHAAGDPSIAGSIKIHPAFRPSKTSGRFSLMSGWSPAAFLPAPRPPDVRFAAWWTTRK